MPIANIVVAAAPQSGNLKSLQSGVNNVRALARQLKEVMDQMTDGADYTHLESQFGLTAGSGVTVYNLVAGLTGPTGLLEAAGIVQFCGRLN